MSIVQVWLQKDSERRLVGSIEEAKIRPFSRTAATLLDNLGPNQTLIKTIVLTDAAPAAVLFILQRINSHVANSSHPLKIRVHELPFARALAVFEAADVMDITPRQTQMHGHIMSCITKDRLTPEDMVNAAKVGWPRRTRDGQQETCKIWRVLVQQIGYNSLHGKYSDVQREKVIEAIKTLPDLFVAVSDKIDQLKELKRVCEERAARQAGREGRQAQGQATNQGRRA